MGGAPSSGASYLVTFDAHTKDEELLLHMLVLEKARNQEPKMA